MSSKHYNDIVIGSGPGGYQCALKLAQSGRSVLCVEKDNLGGTCLNVGCIPSKTLLSSSYKYYEMKKAIKSSPEGVTCSGVEVDLKKMMTNKESVIQAFRMGIAGLFKKSKVTHITGNASFVDKNTISIKSSSGTTKATADNIIIATGSEPITLPNIKVDGKNIITSDEVLSLTKAPKDMVIVGGGVIGLEIASVWSRLGSKVTVVEFLDRVAPTMDKQVSTEIQKILSSQGIEFLLSSKIESATASSGKVVSKILCSKTEKQITMESEKLLMAIGRKPYVTGLDIQKAGVELDERGRIKTDDKLRTTVSNIYAIGDTIQGPMLAHKAEEDAAAVAATINGKKAHLDYNLIPSVVYTHPEIACVGMTEEQLKDKDIPYNVGKALFAVNSRAKATGETEGFVKILSHKQTDTILGVHIVGSQAASMISEACVAMTYGASAEDIATICHSHPDFTEAVKEAAIVATSKTSQ